MMEQLIPIVKYELRNKTAQIQIDSGLFADHDGNVTLGIVGILQDSDNFKIVYVPPLGKESLDISLEVTNEGVELKGILLENLENHPTSVNEATSAIWSALEDHFHVHAIVTMKKCYFPDFTVPIFNNEIGPQKMYGMEKIVQCEFCIPKASSAKTVRPVKGWKILIQDAEANETIVRQFYVKRKKMNVVKSLRSLAADVMADCMDMEDDQNVEKLEVPDEVKKDVAKSLNDYWTA